MKRRTSTRDSHCGARLMIQLKTPEPATVSINHNGFYWLPQKPPVGSRGCSSSVTFSFYSLTASCELTEQFQQKKDKQTQHFHVLISSNQNSLCFVLTGSLQTHTKCQFAATKSKQLLLIVQISNN